MRRNDYNQTKLSIYENYNCGLISESQKDELLLYLEDKKDSELSDDDIDSFFDNLKDQYPDLEDDIEKLAKKIDKSSDGDDNDDDKDDKDDDKDVSEAAIDLMDQINML